jgi:hypothetical protein
MWRFPDRSRLDNRPGGNPVSSRGGRADPGGPVVRAAGVVGELHRPSPPAAVVGMLPLLQDADFPAGEQDRQPVRLIGSRLLALHHRDHILPHERHMLAQEGAQ